MQRILHLRPPWRDSPRAGRGGPNEGEITVSSSRLIKARMGGLQESGLHWRHSFHRTRPWLQALVVSRVSALFEDVSRGRPPAASVRRSPAVFHSERMRGLTTELLRQCYHCAWRFELGCHSFRCITWYITLNGIIHLSDNSCSHESWKVASLNFEVQNGFVFNTEFSPNPKHPMYAWPASVGFLSATTWVFSHILHWACYINEFPLSARTCCIFSKLLNRRKWEWAEEKLSAGSREMNTYKQGYKEGRTGLYTLNFHVSASRVRPSACVKRADKRWAN